MLTQEWDDKAAKNLDYLKKLDESIEQLTQGKGTVHELIEVEDDEKVKKMRRHGGSFCGKSGKLTMNR